MQELVLVQPGRTVGGELEHDAAQADTRREFEERLAECGTQAYRVARGVLRNTACGEDGAPEALLRAYREVARLGGRKPFRPCVGRNAFIVALERIPPGEHTAQRA